MWCHLPAGLRAYHVCEHGWMQQPELMQWVPLSPTPNAFLFLLLGFVAAGCQAPGVMCPPTATTKPCIQHAAV